VRKEQTKPVYVGQPWRVVLRDLEVDERAVLRRAGQPATLFDGDGSWVSVETYYALGDALEAEAGDPAVAVRAGAVVAAELFDPAYFSAICSPDLNTALVRLGEHMRIVGPFSLEVEITNDETLARYRCKHRPDVARALGLSQMAFMVALARRATRHEVMPRRVTVAGPADDLGSCADYFGCPVVEGEAYAVAFDAVDAKRPFLTHNEEMWETFEPGLRRRMAEAGEHRSAAEEVEEALFEFLPSGRTTLNEVAAELRVGSRTLQRRLAAEGTSWLSVLNQTRERLARHYFESTQLSPTEVSFLLGFADPNSLYRAFHRWTGTTPESWRADARRSN
ncbi:MAG: AraC family transcriptional regulator ligand-binding domain-containing protein, partial [Actinomycetota bacterium]